MRGHMEKVFTRHTCFLALQQLVLLQVSCQPLQHPDIVAAHDFDALPAVATCNRAIQAQCLFYALKKGHTIICQWHQVSMRTTVKV